MLTRLHRGSRDHRLLRDAAVQLGGSGDEGVHGGPDRGPVAGLRLTAIVNGLLPERPPAKTENQ